LKSEITRFYSLDLLRGLAAITVVLHHFPLFVSVNNEQYSFIMTHLPLFKWLAMFYHQGGLAVNLFFSLSGFVFFWIYSERVSRGFISASEFLWLRFSRLYPLHLLTLLIILVEQLVFERVNGHYFFAQQNDIKHFFLNLFFIQSWGMESSGTFNVPSWSISVEIALYVVFFIFCQLLPVRGAILLGISLLGFMIVQYAPMSQGVGSFFIGGFMFLLHQRIINSRHANVIAKALGYLTVYAWTITWALSLSWINTTEIEHNLMLQYCPIFILFPLTVLSLTVIETNKGFTGKIFSIIGDISYSVYLIHFPLQLVFYAVARGFTQDDAIFYSSWFMVAFFAVLLPLAWASYHYFELPMQKYLRRSVNFRKTPEKQGVIGAYSEGS
jgi:peptidoglycan/LPS O-acetylase OafA/YrhL